MVRRGLEERRERERQKRWSRSWNSTVAMEMKPAPAYMVRIDTVTGVSISIDLSRSALPSGAAAVDDWARQRRKGCIGLICRART